jgi:PAS domain S-box-containing protein
MADLQAKIIDRLSRNLFLAGISLGLIYWFIESSIHTYIFREGSLFSQVFHPTAHEIWMRMIVALLLAVFSFYGQIMINQRKRAEAALSEREKESALILENNPAAIILIDTQTRKIAYANTNAQKMVGAPIDRILGKSCHTFLCPAEKGNCPVLDLGQAIDISERPLLTAQGDTIPVLKSVTKVQYQGREHLLEAFFDMTEQHKMARDIQQTHAEMDQIFQTASVGMRLIDHNFNILKVNNAFAKLAGVDSRSVVGRKCYDVFEGSMCHTPECPLDMIHDGQPYAEYEVSKKGSDGATIDCILTATRFEDRHGHVAGIVESFRDVSELKKTQKVLESERDKLHRILFHQLESVGIVNARFELEYQNELLRGETNCRTGCRCYKLFRGLDAPCPDCYMQKAVATGKIQRFEFDTRDGQSFEHTYTPFIDNDGSHKAVVSRRDITERKASVEAAIRSEHLAAIGELAAGVAHEINNPINGIINYGQMLVNRTQDDDLLSDVSRRVIKEGDRIAAIVKTLLSFARRESETNELVKIPDVIEDSLTLTRAQLRKDGIHLSVNLADNLVPVPAKAQELQQVFINFLNNSRYALNEKYPQACKDKRIDISVRLISDNGQSRVQASFTDWGTGIKPEMMEKVTHPFFSTKPRGQGTGLGLSISHRIIEDHGGKLTINSVDGAFTRVMVELPVQPAK